MRAIACFTLVISIAACGGVGPQPMTSPSRAQARCVLLASGEEGARYQALFESEPRVRVVQASPGEDPVPVAILSAPLVERARGLYRDLDFDGALAVLGEAQRLLEDGASATADFDALHDVFVHRAMNELALDHVERARDALRSAARLRPQRELDETTVPPDAREVFDAMLAILRQEPPAGLVLSVEPAGARVWLDGIEVGRAPLTLRGLPGKHYVRVEAIGFSSRSFPVDLQAQTAATMGITLPPASEVEAARDAWELEPADDGWVDHVDAASLELAFNTACVLRARRHATTGGERVEYLTRGARSGVASGRLPSPSPARTFADSLAMVAYVRGLVAPPPPSAPPEEPGLLESPWFWGGAAGVVGAAVIVVLLATEVPDPRVELSPNP